MSVPGLPPSVSSLLSASADAESLAASILMKKRELVDYDKKRQQNMEALAQFRPKKPKAPATSIVPPIVSPPQFSPGLSSLVSLGSFFVEMPNEQIKAMLEQDKKTCDQQIEFTRSEIKQLIGRLQRIRPSDLEPALVEFILKEARRSQEGKEMEIDEEDEIEQDELV